MQKTKPLLRICGRLIVCILAVSLSLSIGRADNSLDGQFIELDIESPLRSIYYLPNSRASEAVVGVVILAGEVDFQGPEGLSHYLEHLMFWHADKVNGQEIHGRGGNAWVNGIVTSYYNSGSPDKLGDLFEFTRRIFTAPTLEKKFMLDERKVVSREYDLRLSENPDRRISTRMRRKLYDDHPLSRSVIGTPDSIMSLSIIDALGFHRQYYHPANAVLFVTGDLSADQVKKWVTEKFSTIPQGPLHPQAWRNIDVTGSLDLTETYRDEQVNHDRLAWFSLARWDGKQGRLQDAYTARMLENILQSALPGSLAKPLRLDNFIVRQYELSLYKILDQQIEFQLWASPDDGVSLEEVAQQVDAALVTLAREGIPEKTIERVRKRWLQTSTRLGKNPYETLFRAFNHLSLGVTPNDLDDHMDRIAAVSKGDLDVLLQALADPERRVTGLITGKGNKDE